ncbi:MAG: N-acetyl-gamma-glutamyl-phosphate reductase [Thermoplasmatota archaeon]
MVTAAIVGATGYTGGELLRLLLQHPEVQVTAATSRHMQGKPIHQAHPNLRGASDLRFGDRDAVGDADVVFTCAPHGTAQQIVPDLLDAGHHVVDLSADFRLNATRYQATYGDHACPELLDEAIYGLPEAHRDELLGARLISGVGCFATSMNLALLPLAQAGLLRDATVIVDGKIGSSAAGIDTNAAGMHAARSRSLRLYAPTTHRHAAEVEQLHGIQPRVSVHAAELVRGILATCHVLLPKVPTEKELWKHYRNATAAEPFLRVVKERAGVHRGPDPKLVAGSNFADLGFHVDEAGSRIVATCAIDNLVKGAAGSAVQSVNIAMGLDETAGLTQWPVHPQ